MVSLFFSMREWSTVINKDYEQKWSRTFWTKHAGSSSRTDLLATFHLIHDFDSFLFWFKMY
jgi:hypothetical protein